MCVDINKSQCFGRVGAVQEFRADRRDLPMHQLLVDALTYWEDDCLRCAPGRGQRFIANVIFCILKEKAIFARKLHTGLPNDVEALLLSFAGA